MGLRLFADQCIPTVVKFLSQLACLIFAPGNVIKTLGALIWRSDMFIEKVCPFFRSSGAVYSESNNGKRSAK